MKKIFISLKNINFKLLIALIFMALVPSVYTTIRVYFLGNLPNEWSYSIAGQLEWVNLIYEIINEAIILPLFFFMGKVVKFKPELNNRVRTGLLVTSIIYLVISIIIIASINSLLKVMAVNSQILEESTNYIRIEAFANIFVIIQNFALVVLITINKNLLVYIITFVKLILYIIFDTFLVSNQYFSANLGVIGIAVSNIFTNLILFCITISLLYKFKINLFTKRQMDFKWLKSFAKIGGISGLESFVRNFAYIIMISRMVNVVNEAGVFWVANSFIWGWLLLPINQLSELIKQEVSTNKDNLKNNSLGYYFLTFIFIAIWFITIPAYKPFMSNVLNFSEIDKLYNLVMISIGFYFLYAIQNVFDSIFYGIGKTHYMLFESVVTNALYYGIAFGLYQTGVWKPSLINIALLFGIGMAFDSLVSLAAYIFLLKKYKINILEVETNKKQYAQSEVYRYVFSYKKAK